MAVIVMIFSAISVILRFVLLVLAIAVCIKYLRS